MTTIVEEAARLLEAVFGIEAAAVAAAVAILFFATRAVERWIERRQLGLPRVRRLAVSALRVVAGAAAVLFVLRYLARAAPTIITALVLVTLAGLALGAGLWARTLVIGAVAILRSKLAEGDVLEIGDVRGTIANVGLASVAVVTADGARVRVPATAFAESRYAVASPERVHPVEAQFEVEDVERASATLRRLALLCPYRERASTVEVRPLGPNQVVVRFRAWSEAGARLARAYLVSGLGGG